MPIESATYLSELDARYPEGADEFRDGDNHLRLIKSALKATFPNADRAIRLQDYAFSSETVSRSLTAADEGKFLYCLTPATGIVLTLPADVPIGWRVVVRNATSQAGEVAIAPSTGETFLFDARVTSGRVELPRSGMAVEIIRVSGGTPWAVLRFDEVSAADEAMTVTVPPINGLAGAVEAPLTADYTVVIADRGKTRLVDASGGAIEVSLPQMSSALTGVAITIVKIDSVSANAVTITPDAADTISGAMSYALDAQYDSVTLKADGGNTWLVIAKVEN